MKLPRKSVLIISDVFLRHPTPAEAETINDRLQPFFCRTTKEQLEVPPALPDKILICPASGEENRLLSLLVQQYRENKLALFLRILQLESNPRLLLQKPDLREFRYLLDNSAPAEDSGFADYDQEARRLVEACLPSAKLLRCVQLVKELVKEGKPVIVRCVFLDSIHLLSEALEAQGVSTHRIYGAVPLEERQGILRDFKLGRFFRCC